MAIAAEMYQRTIELHIELAIEMLKKAQEDLKVGNAYHWGFAFKHLCNASTSVGDAREAVRRAADCGGTKDIDSFNSGAGRKVIPA